MNKQHKHADLIKAWADGANIQFYFITYREWVDIHSPSWLTDVQYRIKPKPVGKIASNVDETNFIQWTRDVDWGDGIGSYTYKHLENAYFAGYMEAINADVTK